MKTLKSFTLVSIILTLFACSGEDGRNGIGEDGLNGTPGSDSTAGQIISLKQSGRTLSRGFAVGASEIVAYDKANNRIFSINAQSGLVDVFSDVSAEQPAFISSIELAPMLLANSFVSDVADVGGANSIDVFGNYAAIAVQANPKTDNGWVVFLNLSNLSFAEAVEVGALPDMVTFTPNGTKLLVANEGEPAVDYSLDAEGSVSVINVSNFSVSHIDFSDFNEGNSRFSELNLSRIVLDGYSASNPDNKASVAQSFEPEFITVSDDNGKAFVALQENNAIVVIDLTDNSIEKIFGLGFKDHSIPGNEIDAGDADGGVNLKTWPVMGIYMPDSIDSFTYNGKTFIVTANEGDSREDWLLNISDQTSCESAGYYFYSSQCLDEVRVKHFISRAGLTISALLTSFNGDLNLGRLKASYHTTRIMNGNSRSVGSEKTSTINKVYAYGARSFSIWDIESGEQIFDSGNDFERITALRYGVNFNNGHDVTAGDSRSDDKGPEPEAITIGKINGFTYAFIGLERMGGVMVYDISNPYAPKYVQYINNRDLTVQPAGDANNYTVDAGDLGPEGMKFISAADSPDNKNYLLVGNEVSGTTAVFEITTHLFQPD